MGAHPLYVALSQRGLLDPIKPAYNQSWLDGRLKLTASASDRLWISMLAVLVTVPTVVQNSLHPLSTSSIIARHLVDFLVRVKITEADTNPVISPFLCQMPSLLQPSQFILAWDRHQIMHSCIPSGLVRVHSKDEI